MKHIFFSPSIMSKGRWEEWCLWITFSLLYGKLNFAVAFSKFFTFLKSKIFMGLFLFLQWWEYVDEINVPYLKNWMFK